MGRIIKLCSIYPMLSTASSESSLQIPWEVRTTGVTTRALLWKPTTQRTSRFDVRLLPESFSRESLDVQVQDSASSCLVPATWNLVFNVRGPTTNQANAGRCGSCSEQ